MIPTIEQIVEGVAAGTITKSQAVTWLHQHAECAYRTLRDDFAAVALPALIAAGNVPHVTRDDVVGEAYLYADAMLDRRLAPDARKSPPAHPDEGRK